MWDVAASPNDPIFINHHAMIDCIFEEWISNHPNVQYPTDRQDKIHDGHKADDYIVPFIPLYKHKEMFKTADNFGYSCTLKRIKPTEEPTETTGATTTKSNRSSTLKVSLSLFLCLLIVIF